MENKGMTAKNTNKSGFNFGRQGLFIIILAFLTMYTYTALIGDSLNVTIKVFGAMGLNTNVLYSLSTVGTVCGIVATIVIGKLLSKTQVRVMWGILELTAAVFILIWSTVHTTELYVVCYLVFYAVSACCANMLLGMVIANWFPRTRGSAMGLITVGYPLSAATTTTVCTLFVNSNFGIGGYYRMMAIVAAVIGICMLLFVRDNPEEKGCYPDNNHAFDYDAIKAEHEKSLEYQKTSKWKPANILKCGRFWNMMVALVMNAFASQGIMANFVNRFAESGYQIPEILGMLTVAGVLAIPMSVLFGWLDVKIGTKKTGMLISALAIIGITFATIDVRALNYVALPILAVMLGGANNLSVAMSTSIFGRYNFKNVQRCYAPIMSSALGLGITVVGIIGTNFNYHTAYKTILVLVIIGFIAMCKLKLTPIDDEVR